jgi:arylsulfatase A-like enzyme
MSDRPNVLWITTDHQRTDALGCYGSPWGVSPHIDALADQGVRFAQCTSQSPSCSPSRASFWVGKYPNRLEPWAYNKDKESHHPSVPFVRRFRDAGYQTVQLGKLDHIEFAKEFDICEHGPGPGAALGPFASMPEGKDEADYDILRVPRVNLAVGGKNPLPPDQSICGIMAERAERFFEQKAKAPFFMRWSIDCPHMPFLPLPEFFGTVDRDKIDLPYPTEAELATKPQREARHIRRFYNFDRLTHAELDYCRACYYDLCAELDAAIGRVLASLKAHGLDDNTIVCLHTDHGTTLGEHGVGTIRTFYEPVIQIPFIWSWPGHLPPHTAIDDPVELIDIAPTLLDLAGLDVPEELEGRSLVEQMHGRASDPHRPTFSEYNTALAPIGGADWIPKEATWEPEHDRRVMVRHDGWKLDCNYGPSDYGDDGALYDLRADPDELDNLFDKPEHQSKVDQLKQIVQAWLDQAK